MNEDIDKIGNNNEDIFRLFLQIDGVLRGCYNFVGALYKAIQEKKTEDEKLEKIPGESKQPKKRKRVAPPTAPKKKKVKPAIR